MLFAQTIAGEQGHVQAGFHLTVGVAQGVNPIAQQRFAAVVNGEVAGLEQQSLWRDVVHIKGGQQFFMRHHLGELGRKKLPLGQQFDEKGGRAGLEPIGFEFAVAKQQQQIKRVVNTLAQPVVAVVPAADMFAV